MIGLDGSHVRNCHGGEGRHFEVIAGKVVDAEGTQYRFAFVRNAPVAASDAFKQALAAAGVDADTPATVLCDGDAGLWRLLREVVGIRRFQRHVSDLLGYLARNQEALVHYAARRRRGEPISTAFVESAVNEIVARRMNKKQQMRWSRTTVQPFLDVRTAVLDGTLEEAFRRRYRGFRPVNDERATTVAA